jgi:hypothetical protein
VSPPLSPTGDADGDDVDEPVSPEARSAAAAALHHAFTRLRPQGGDPWNFLAAFTHLGDRYGPDHPGATGTSSLIGSDKARAERRGGPRGTLDRIRTAAGRGRTPEDGTTELEEAMAQVVEAFRFLSARVETLEARLAAQDHPIDGAAWLAPARELGVWVELIAAHVLDRAAGGDVVHADCGEGALVAAMAAGGAHVQGVEPRGAVALQALEQGRPVVICEVFEHLSTRPSGTLGGIVLSGVVDRVPVSALVPLLAQCRRTLALGAPFVVVTEPAGGAVSWGPPASELLAGRPLHVQTWAVLLERAGFTTVERVEQPDGAATDSRLVLSAAVPS